jgi:hypothetical protein
MTRLFRRKQVGGSSLPVADLTSSSSPPKTARRLGIGLISFFLLGISGLWFEFENSARQLSVALEPVQEKAASKAVSNVVGNSNFYDKCSSESLYQNPSNFGECIIPSPSPSCKPRQTENWDQWVGRRYKQFPSCITSQLMKEMNREWAISGKGSSLETTASTRKLLADMFRDESLDIKTFFDCPSGDWLWMQEVDLDGLQYFGGDITSMTIQKNTECFESPNVHFHVLDWSCEIPPPVDLLMVRDVLFHLSTSVVQDILFHINQSGAKYLLTTSFGNTTSVEDNYVSDGVGYRNINLYGPPYNFPSPIKFAQEGRRHVGLWKLPIVPVK